MIANNLAAGQFSKHKLKVQWYTSAIEAREDLASMACVYSD
jgi:hypothetical protein